MAKAETKAEKIEREYIIPLREKCRPVPRYKKTPKAVRTIKEFLLRHMKMREGDLNSIRIDSYLNEQIWMRGIKNPVHKIKVKAVKEDDIVRVYSADLPKNIKFKKLREEKIEEKAKEELEKKKTLMEKAKETMKNREEPVKDSEKKEEETEKEKSSMVSEELLEKESAKEMKHTAKTNPKKEKQSERKGYDATSRGR
jgi:large subunit ribosomal protein L31e